MYEQKQFHPVTAPTSHQTERHELATIPLPPYNISCLSMGRKKPTITQLTSYHNSKSIHFYSAVSHWQGWAHHALQDNLYLPILSHALQFIKHCSRLQTSLWTNLYSSCLPSLPTPAIPQSRLQYSNVFQLRAFKLQCQWSTQSPRCPGQPKEKGRGTHTLKAYQYSFPVFVGEEFHLRVLLLPENARHTPCQITLSASNSKALRK